MGFAEAENVKEEQSTSSFDFTPNQTIPVNSYYLKSTGHMTLNITN